MEPCDRFDIVRINQRNVDVLDVVADDVFDDEINGELLQAVLANGQLLLTAIVEGAVVGQLQAMIQHHLDGAPQLYVDNLGVSPLHQRRGIARRLIQEVWLWANELGCQEAWIVTDLDNQEANGLYRSIGAERSTVALYSIDQLNPSPGDS
jgi:ribosomal protein S18 acetylase RimI-like enzyme